MRCVHRGWRQCARARVAAGALAFVAIVGHAAATAASPSGIVTFIHLNDLHAHLTPRADVVPAAPPGRATAATQVVERGGLARIATLIKRIRADNPHSVLMNIGDTYHGGVEAFYTNGNAIVDPVDALGIDVAVPGNWDFAYGPIVTRRRYTDLPLAHLMEIGQAPRERIRQRVFGRLRDAVDDGGDDPNAGRAALERIEQMMTPMGEVKRPSFPHLAANVTFKFPLRYRGRTLLPPTLMKSVGGVQVGFIGITSDIVPRMHWMLAFGLNFLEGEDNYRELIERHARALREDGAHIVVVLSELGIHKDYLLANIIGAGAVDVFFSAHTHEAIFQPLRARSGALVVEAGNDGYLGRMDVRVRDGRITARDWTLLPVTEDIPDDPAVQAVVERARAPFLARAVDMQAPMPAIRQRLTQPIDTVVGYTEAPLDRHHALDSRFNRAMAAVIRGAAGTELAMTPGFRFDAVIGVPTEQDDIVDGAVTVEDLYRLFPAPYEIAVARVSGERLRAVMEESLTYVFSPSVFRHSGGWFEGYAGLVARVDLTRPDGRRVLELRRTDGHAAIAPGDSVSIAGCKRPFDTPGILCSYSGFEDVRPLDDPRTGEPWTPINLLAYALSKGPLPAAGRRTIEDVSDTRLWPDAPFVQPLEGVRPTR